jgi:hypothetical protein
VVHILLVGLDARLAPVDGLVRILGPQVVLFQIFVFTGDIDLRGNLGADNHVGSAVNFAALLLSKSVRHRVDAIVLQDCGDTSHLHQVV